MSNEILDALRRAELIGARDTPAVTALSGGVSADVFKVELATQTICVKRPVERLRVAAEWRAPVARAESEVAWLEFAASVEPDCVPRVLFEDIARHLFAMEYLPPEIYPGWKAQLLQGVADATFAGQVGARLARLHEASAGRADVEAQFACQKQFFALRLEPYLLHTAKAHPRHAARIETLAQGIADARIALMQGDISPKNILCGPKGPVFLDAETACYGDPAFDLAFCLNHLLLKAAYRKQDARAYHRSFAALSEAYLAGVTWEEPQALDRRTASLLPALFLARVDGKSPVEYLTDPRDKELVRNAALGFLAQNDLTLATLASQWQAILAA
ncbi:MAG TPA: aminoglycoside phosphotransferase family protein [Rhizomicrobium sp.]|nr:aminoglycoside phosphotransferase family protein [Rhizomicrobium sp.]